MQNIEAENNVLGDRNDSDNSSNDNHISVDSSSEDNGIDDDTDNSSIDSGRNCVWGDEDYNASDMEGIHPEDVLEYGNEVDEEHNDSDWDGIDMP